MVNIAGTEIPINLGGIGISGGLITILAVIFIMFLGLGILYYIWTTYRIYNKKIILFENISGQGFQITGRDRARTVKVGDGGEELLFLLKRKVYRTAYGKKMGKNTYWFAIGQDGYWYNTILGDLDAKMGMLDIEPIDRDMRYMHVAVRRNTQDRYRKVKFMEKYGTIMMSGMFILIMIVGIWFLLDKMGDIATEINRGLEASTKVQETTNNILSSLDNIVSGTGISGVG